METGAWRSEVTQGHIAYKGGIWIPKPEKVRTQVHPLFPTSPWVLLGWVTPGWGWGMLWAKDIVIVDVSESQVAFVSGLNYLKRLFFPTQGMALNPFWDPPFGPRLTPTGLSHGSWTGHRWLWSCTLLGLTQRHADSPRNLGPLCVLSSFFICVINMMVLSDCVNVNVPRTLRHSVNHPFLFPIWGAQSVPNTKLKRLSSQAQSIRGHFR